MGIGDNQLHTPQTTAHQTAQDVGPAGISRRYAAPHAGTSQALLAFTAWNCSSTEGGRLTLHVGRADLRSQGLLGGSPLDVGAGLPQVIPVAVPTVVAFAARDAVAAPPGVTHAHPTFLDAWRGDLRPPLMLCRLSST